MNRHPAHASVPRPLAVESRPHRLHLSPTTTILLSPGGSGRARFAAQRLSELVLEEFGIELAVIYRDCDRFAITLSAGEPPDEPDLLAEHGDLGEEGYVLEVTQGVARIQSPTARGLFWGAMTLRQLIERSADGLVIRGVRIVDKPRYRWRGFMIDSGRSPNSLPKIKRIIRICSALKLNLLVFREGDDELCSVKYNTNLLGSTNPLAFSMDQVRELVDFADRYGITLVPEIESLGHSTAKGFHCPELVSGGFEHPYEGIGTHVRKSHLAPADPGSYRLLESVYNEWFPLLNSPLVHLGLDEVRLEPGAQAKHLEGLLEIVDRVAARHGREITPIVWADAPRTPPESRSRVIRCLWGYGDSPEHVNLSNGHLLRQGLAELSEPGCEEQAFMAAGSGSGHTPGSKTRYEDAFHNIAEWAMWGNDRPNFTGLIAVQWSGNETDNWLPDFAAAADCAWNPPEGLPDFDRLMARVGDQLSRLKDAADPSPSEIDPPAWDGITLRDGRWHKDLVAQIRAATKCSG